MKVAFVQTYPVYHDFQKSARQWLALENRDKWMPAILADEGYEVELWGIARKELEHRYYHPLFSSYTIRLFPASHTHKHSKRDFSLDLLDYARHYDADLHILKGIDGGAGVMLLEEYLLPRNKAFVLVIGGKYYNPYISRASGIFYESDLQLQRLVHPWKAYAPWRAKPAQERMLQLPKSIDTRLFKPMPEINKEFDVISAGRLIPRYKNYSALGELDANLKLGLIGDGPLRNTLQQKYRNLKLVGAVSNGQMPGQLNRGRIFFHPGRNDFFPRVIPEAMACGLPCIAYKNIISNEVIPPGCGFRINPASTQPSIRKLLLDENRLRRYGDNARQYIVQNHGMASSREPMLKMLKLLDMQLNHGSLMYE